MIIQRYYQCVKGSHHKDYTMTIDETALSLVTEWGRIGGTKQRDVFNLPTLGDLRALIDEKHNRRMKNGYTLLSTNEAGGAYAVSSNDFESDLQDLLAAERIAG